VRIDVVIHPTAPEGETRLGISKSGFGREAGKRKNISSSRVRLRVSYMHCAFNRFAHRRNHGKTLKEHAFESGRWACRRFPSVNVVHLIFQAFGLERYCANLYTGEHTS
jgi:hypothetical protein